MDAPLKDPVCGMPVDARLAVATAHVNGQVFYFCSTLCQTRFNERPHVYTRPERARGPLDPSHARVAYFSMEIACAPDIPTYAGGLGILAGDMLRAFADLQVPAVGVTLVHRKGYFRQLLGANGEQQEVSGAWNPGGHAVRLDPTVRIQLFGRTVEIAAWRYELPGRHSPVAVLLLDTDLPQNAESDRHITDELYGGDARYRIAQEMVLGVGGLRMLDAAGYTRVQKLHLNEGHAAFAALELLQSQHANLDRGEWNFEAARGRCVFTTHTPVPAGHDYFDWPLAHEAWSHTIPEDVFQMLGGASGALNMTALALNLSGFVNGVAKQHRIVTEQMFPGYEVHGVTNGVHSEVWTCDAFKALYDQWVPDWRGDPATLRNALVIPGHAIWAAHVAAKARMLRIVAERTGRELRPDAFTLGFARRATTYKRFDMLVADPVRLSSIANQFPLQIVFSGKAHPHDGPGKALIQRVFAAARELGDAVPIVYVPDYDIELARALVSGVDLWVNTPQPPLEASGTSGMKAAHNGIPSLSTLDGWWLEGHVEGVTGWSIGTRPGALARESHADTEEMYSKLERTIAAMFYGDREAWTDVMRHAVALNASFFNAHRMVQQYALGAYL